MLSKGTKIAVAAAALVGAFTGGGVLQSYLDFDRLDKCEAESLANEQTAQDAVVRLLQTERIINNCVLMYADAAKELDEYQYRYKVCLGILKGEER